MQTGPPTHHPILEGLIDYAGLFPPASLPLAIAIVEYRGLLDCADAHVLGRFILPATRLDEITAFLHLFDRSSPLRLCLLAIPGAHAADIGQSVEYAVATGETFVSASEGRVRVDVIETRLTDRELDSPDLIERSLDHAARASTPRPLYVEMPFSRRQQASFGALGALATARRAGLTELGAKIRCGGDAPEDVPNPAVVAKFLYRCLDWGVPFKATAGLHHPVRSVTAEHGPTHGFLNVFAAAVLGHARDLDEQVLVQILDETDPEAFSLESGGISWRGFAATPVETERARSAIARSFGSCSFDEPTSDLRAMGWLGTAPVPGSQTIPGSQAKPVAAEAVPASPLPTVKTSAS